MSHSTDQDIEQFFKKYKTLIYKKGEIVIRSGDTPQGIYYLDSGYIKMNSLTTDGRELTLNIFKPGSYFPIFWAYADIPNNYSFQTMTDATLFRAPKIDFMQYLDSNPIIERDFSKRIMIGLSGLIDTLQQFLISDANIRVRSVVLTLLKRFANDTSDFSVKIPVTHQDIADAAGITRETASLELKNLEHAGIISHQYGKLTVLKPDELTNSVKELTD